jgi:hypothetical protein
MAGLVDGVRLPDLTSVDPEALQGGQRGDAPLPVYTCSAEGLNCLHRRWGCIPSDLVPHTQPAAEAQLQLLGVPDAVGWTWVPGV